MKNKFRYGGFSIAITLLVIVAVFALNIFATYVEANNGLRADFTPTRSYTLDGSSKAAIEALNTDVVIYSFIPTGAANEYSGYTENICAMFDGASDKITYKNVDPVVNPTVKEKFSKETNPLTDYSVVICQKDNEENFQAFNQETFVEGNYFVLQREITSALVYMRTGNKTNVYVLTGHGEDVASYEVQTMLNRISRENCNVEEINLATDEKKLQAGDILLVLQPKHDLSKIEFEKIRTFLADEYGEMMFMCSKLYGEGGEKFENYSNLLEYFHIELNDGFIAETSGDNFTNNDRQTIKLNADQSHDISKAIRAAGTDVIVKDTASYAPFDKIVTETFTENLTPVLMSYASSVLVPWNNAGNYDVNEYKNGTMTVCGAYERINTSLSDTPTTRILLFGSVNVGTNDSLGNTNIIRNGIKWLAGIKNTNYIDNVGMSIDLTGHYVLLSQAQMQAWFIILVVAVPAVIFVFGMVVWFRRKNL